jgi:hypothetical protein
MAALAFPGDRGGTLYRKAGRVGHVQVESGEPVAAGDPELDGWNPANAVFALDLGRDGFGKQRPPLVEK